MPVLVHHVRSLPAPLRASRLPFAPARFAELLLCRVPRGGGCTDCVHQEARPGTFPTASYTKDEIVNLVLRANAVFDAIEALPQIVIAAINGKVVAGASELCLACDLRYAVAHATWVMPEATWGGFPGAGAPVRLPRIVGRARALELICTGREIDAPVMERLGLVQGVFPRENFAASVAAIARTIAGNGPLAVRGAKQIVAAREAPGFRPARELSDALRRKLEWSHDVDEGIAAHAENRKPTFLGGDW